MVVFSSGLKKHQINTLAVFIPFVNHLYSCRQAWRYLEGALEAVHQSI